MDIKNEQHTLLGYEDDIVSGTIVSLLVIILQISNKSQMLRKSMFQ
jgi:hypothetical protein